MPTQAATNRKNYLTVTEVAKALNAHPSTVRVMLAKRQLPGAIKLGTGPRGHWRIPTTAHAALTEA